MKKSDILITRNRGIYNIKIEGRASFEYAPLLRNLAKNLENENFTKISIDLKNCTAMDSTFMGILAMLGLTARKVNATVEILNANVSNIALLENLGLKKLFTFTDREEKTDKLASILNEPVREDSELDRARTVVDAHDTLMDVDNNNVSKFRKVVDFAKKDLKKLEKKSSENQDRKK